MMNVVVNKLGCIEKGQRMPEKDEHTSLKMALATLCKINPVAKEREKGDWV